MKLVIATQNSGKVREFKRILSPLGIDVISAVEAGVTADIEETGATFAENARIKALAVMQLCGMPAVADDSGLCVDALHGAPGVYSARYAGEGATDSQRIDKLLAALADVSEEQRGAQFVSAICCCFPDGTELAAQGECHGAIGREKRGDGGFGYDPVFMAEHRSFAELSAEQKDAISHRGKALRAFYSKLLEYQQTNNKEQAATAAGGE